MAKTPKKPAEATKAEVVEVEAGTVSWAMEQLRTGSRVHRTSWNDGLLLDPKHLGGGFGLMLADLHAQDWAVV